MIPETLERSNVKTPAALVDSDVICSTTVNVEFNRFTDEMSLSGNSVYKYPLSVSIIGPRGNGVTKVSVDPVNTAPS